MTDSCLFYDIAADHRVLHRPTHPFPPQRASDLGPTMAPPNTGPMARSVLMVPDTYGPSLGCTTLVHRNSSETTAMGWPKACSVRSEEHTSELQSLMRISYAVFCLKKKNIHYTT